jgi:glutamate synthase domain-containing protein 2
MNLQQPNANEVTQTQNRSRSVSPVSGICTRCIDGCRGNCEIFKSSFRGREVIYPGPFGTLTAGADKEYPIDYSHLNIMGYALGAKGLADGVEGNPDTTLFPMVSTETAYGAGAKVKMRVPVFTGALGSTDVARKNWEHFAAGAAISGISIVCGENVCGIDPQLELDANGKVKNAPNMAQRVEQYRRYHEGYGDMLVQMNVEDTRLGVAEYVIDKLGIECVELKWGQGAKCIGGEIQVDSLERALELQKRGYLVTPDPSVEAHQAAFKDGALKHFERHSRLGFVDQDGFMKEVERLRKLGAKRVTLKTGAYPMRELAMAVKWASDAKLAMAGGFSTEDHIFKVLAMGAPFTKAVCMGRALMIPGMVGKNIGLWLKEGTDALPKTVSTFGTKVEEIFVCYEDLVAKYGKKTVDAMPLGAVALFTFADKLKVGLQQLMAGSRNFNVSAISRADLVALTPEAAQVSGISYVMDAYKEEAEQIING